MAAPHRALAAHGGRDVRATSRMMRDTIARLPRDGRHLVASWPHDCGALATRWPRDVAPLVVRWPRDWRDGGGLLLRDGAAGCATLGRSLLEGAALGAAACGHAPPAIVGDGRRVRPTSGDTPVMS
ncbi:hypothetical protein F511_47382 [Dorcoceras hygrometricum]|uniref:Uncharacterized protein n=1 Tax=Dorcoceras hygrometricum TaxID=472368 RepID=A0A2Z6ZXN5_9LAMI|nr:hypothetical protein F511_47382 [Dorcoceras hygrometricum]